MADVSFVHSKSYPSGQFALHRVPLAGHDLTRKTKRRVSPSTRITSPPTG